MKDSAQALLHRRPAKLLLIQVASRRQRISATALHPMVYHAPDIQKNSVDKYSPQGAYATRASSIAASVTSPCLCFAAMSFPRRFASVMTAIADSSSRMLPVLVDSTSRILSSISFSCRLFSAATKVPHQAHQTSFVSNCTCSGSHALYAHSPSGDGHQAAAELQWSDIPNPMLGNSCLQADKHEVSTHSAHLPLPAPALPSAPPGLAAPQPPPRPAAGRPGPRA